MSFSDTVFGRKKPTSATASTALAKLEAELRAAPARVERAENALKLVADLTDEDHAAAEAELAAARRALARLQAQAEQLRAVHRAALKADADAALRARVREAQRSVDSDYPALVDQLDAKMAEVAGLAARIEAIDREVESVNYDVAAQRRADPGGSHPDPVVTSQERFRTEPDVVEPDRTIVEERWEVQREGRWTGASVFRMVDGKQVPEEAGARLRRVERVIPGTTRAGRVLVAPTLALVLPATRLGAAPHWPRRG